MKRAWPWLLILCWLEPLGAQPLPNPVGLEASSILGNHARIRRPFPIKVTVRVPDPQRQRPEDLLTLETNRGEVPTKAPVRLTAGNQSLTLPLVSAAYGASVSLDGIARMAHSTNSLSSLVLAPDQDYLALVLSPRENDFNYLGGYKQLLGQGELRRNFPTELAELPENWWLYLGQDAILIHNLPALKLSDAVEKALLDWTRTGGRLILSSNGDPFEYRESALQTLLPMQPEARLQAALPQVLGPAPSTSVVMRHQGHPLLLKRPLGLGWIYQVTSDITQAGNLGNDLSATLWKNILRNDRDLIPRNQSFEGEGLLLNLPELPPPATSALAWYLAGYVLVAIPAAYVILRRRDQVLHLIVVVPTLALLFSLGAYYFNTSGRGRELVMRELGLVYVVSGQTSAISDQTSVVFSPAGGTFDVVLPDSVLVRPASEFRYNRDQPALHCRGKEMLYPKQKLAHFGVSRWRSFGLHSLDGPFEFSLKGQDPVVQARLHNRSGVDISHLALVVDRARCSAFQPLPSGKAITLDAPANPQSLDDLLRQSPTALEEDDLLRLTNQIEMARQGRPVAIGWTDSEKLGSLQVRGLSPRKIRQSLVLIMDSVP